MKSGNISKGILEPLEDPFNKSKTNQHVEIDGKQYEVKYKKNGFNNIAKGILPTEKKPQKYVEINGKQYEVQTVRDNSLKTMLDESLQPKTKEVVIIDGKQYDVQNNGMILKNPLVMDL